MGDFTAFVRNALSNVVERIVGADLVAPGWVSAGPPRVFTAESATSSNEPRRRILDEIELVAPHFERHGDVRWDPHGDWFMIERYPLPARWKERWTKLLILIPAAYPVTPPVGFYLDRPGRLRDGGRDDHLTGQAYYTAPDLRALGWFWYCLHVSNGSGGWRPSADWREPDNLWSYVAVIREALTNEE